MPKQSRIFYGWWVVAACFVVSLCASCARYTISIFSPFMLEELGWTRSSIGFALTLHMIVYAVGATFVGKLTDKYGARWVMTVGGFFLILGLCLLSTITTVLEFYLYYSIIAALGVTTTFLVPNSATARKWFIKKAGLSVGIIAAGAGLGLAVVSPIAASLIGAFGWRTCYIIIGLSVGVPAILSAFIFVRKDPETMGLLPDGELEITPNRCETNLNSKQQLNNEVVWHTKEALHTQTFWCLFFAYAMSLLGLQGLTAHMGIWGADIAIKSGQSLTQTKGTIGAAMMVMALCGVAAKLVAGPLSDRVGRKPILYFSCLLQICAFAYALMLQSLSSFVFFSIVMGISYGMAIPIWTPLLGDIFGRLSVATLFGFLTFAVGIIGGLGPVIFGWFYDAFGSYNGGFIFSIGILAVTLILVTRINPVEKKG